MDPTPPDETIDVLHVDNEEDQLVFTKLFLEQIDANIRVTPVCSPDEAIEKVKGGGFDCLVVDYRMPTLDGVQLAERIRAFSDIHIIIYTGQGSEEVAGAAFAAGVNDYIRKEVEPSHYKVLAKRIRSGVENQRNRRKYSDKEKELAWMADNSSDAIFRIELDKGITRSNPAFRALYGSQVNGVIPFEDFIPSRISQEEYERFEQVTEEAILRGSRDIKLTHQWKTADGDTLWFETLLSTIMNDGQLVGFEAVARDITERVRIEEELRENRERLSMFLESATDLIVLLDKDLRILEVNDKALLFLGKARKQVVGKNITKVEPTLKGSDLYRKFIEVMETGEPYTYNDLIPHITDSDGHLTLRLFKVGEGLGIIATDISESKRYQRELQETERNLQILVDNIPDVFYIADGDGGTVFASPNIQKMTGYTAEEITKPDPMFWFNLVYHEDLQRVKDAIRAYIEEDIQYDVEYRVHRSDDSLIWVRDRATQRYDHEGTVYFDGKLSDITEQKIMERGLKGYTEHLERMVEDLKVYSQQLEETVKERNRLLVDAERNIAVSQVASMVGHDLRGPLQTINNAVYLIQRNPDNSRELLDTIKGSVQYAVKILEDLRIATRDAPLDVEPVDFNELVTLTVNEATAPGNATINVELGDDLDTVYVDPVKIRRVLDNLIRNACEALQEPGAVTVRARRDGWDLVVEVADTGVGIPEDFLPNLFQTFKTTKRRGLGLGLAYSKKSVEAHGGTIEVESRAGAGTTFTVRLPQPQDHEPRRVESHVEAEAPVQQRENTGS
ncbi:MAG: PAS domain S-box protein [Candidatus Bathyarchaeota archaeon]